MEACQKCGACCKVLAMRVPKTDTMYREFFSARGLLFDAQDDEVLLVPSRCQYLTPENKCQVYDVRPDICRLFPKGNSYLPMGCVFRARNKSAP